MVMRSYLFLVRNVSSLMEASGYLKQIKMERNIYFLI